MHTYVLRDNTGSETSVFRGDYVVEDLPNISIYDGLTLVAALILQPGQFVVRLEDPKPKPEPTIINLPDSVSYAGKDRFATIHYGKPDLKLDLKPADPSLVQRIGLDPNFQSTGDPVDANAAPQQERTSGCKYHTSPDVQAPQPAPVKVKKNPTEFRLRPLEIFKYKAFTDSLKEQVFAVERKSDNGVWHRQYPHFYSREAADAYIMGYHDAE
jgi:hypothetical protein